MEADRGLLAMLARLKQVNREPMFHISSPIEGWKGPKPERYHDYIDVGDFPKCWLKLNLTVEVEAKAKEVAVLKLAGELKNQDRRRGSRKSNDFSSGPGPS